MATLLHNGACHNDRIVAFALFNVHAFTDEFWLCMHAGMLYSSHHSGVVTRIEVTVSAYTFHKIAFIAMAARVCSFLFINMCINFWVDAIL